jgi:hypothetical protein
MIGWLLPTSTTPSCASAGGGGAHGRAASRRGAWGIAGAVVFMLALGTALAWAGVLLIGAAGFLGDLIGGAL